MKTFNEFVQERQYEDIKKLIMNILDPQDELEDKDTLNDPLGKYNSKENLLKDPNLLDIINKRPNREAIIAAIQKDDTTTIGNLISLLTQDSEPELVG